MAREYCFSQEQAREIDNIEGKYRGQVQSELQGRDSCSLEPGYKAFGMRRKNLEQDYMQASTREKSRPTRRVFLCADWLCAI